jgi:hypothetical protein
MGSSTTVAPAADKRARAALKLSATAGDRSFWNTVFGPRTQTTQIGGRWNAISFRGQDLVEQCTVGYGFRDRPRRIERERQRQHTVKRYTPGGGLETDQAVQCGRNADRSAGVGADCARRHAVGDRDRCP